MCRHRFSAKRLLPGVLLLAVLAGEPAAISAQPAAAEVSPASSQFAAEGAEPISEIAGDSLLVQRRYQEAIAAYEKAPGDSPLVWNKMGIAYQMLFDLKDAERCYKRSLRLNHRDARVLNNLGTVYNSLGDYGKAERRYREALKLDPKSALVAMNLGTDLMFQHRYNEGWEMYQRAVALNPDVFEGLNAPVTTRIVSVRQRGAMNYYTAKGYAQAGMVDRAISYLRRALSEGFTNPAGIARDESFAALRGNPAFERLMAEQRNQ